MLSLKLNENNEKIILIIAAYSFTQILAEDLGIKTGKKQRDLIRSYPLQIIILFAGAYTVTNDINLTAITIAIYYGLKYIYSEGETFNICFEEV